MKTSELSGAALDWAVAKCEGVEGYVFKDGSIGKAVLKNYKPSTDWAQGGPIIEQEKMSVRFDFEEDEWQATAGDFDDWIYGWGETPLVAAMRCYVASKLGDEVEISQELKGE